MTREGCIEILLICLVSAMSWLAWPYFSSPTPIWQIVLAASTLILLQSLIRDIIILIRDHYSTSHKLMKEAQCFCLESTVGASGIAIGLLLLGLGSPTEIIINRWELFFATLAILGIGFVIKDWVITWNPLGLTREKNHLNVIVRWKSKNQK